MDISEKKRGVWLTILLVFLLIANFVSALINIVFSIIIAPYSGVSIWTWYISGLLALANFVFVIFLFMWKKWPFFAYCGTAIITIIMSLVIGFGIFVAIFGLAGPIILYFSMRSRWDFFE